MLPSPPLQVDWRDRRHWRCNNNVHPSRHGTYDGITMHPFETVFLKASWHVGEPFVDKYAAWMLSQASARCRGAPSTRCGLAVPRNGAVHRYCCRVLCLPAVTARGCRLICPASIAFLREELDVPVLRGGVADWRESKRRGCPLGAHTVGTPVAPTTHRNPPPPACSASLQAAGRDTTSGQFDERMYRYAISMQAQESHNVERCYQVGN